MNGQSNIKLAGKEWAVTLPDFATREDLALAWHESATKGDGAALRRVAGAAIGICTGVGKRAGVTFTGTALLVYGGAVYSWLREQRETIPNVMEAGGQIVSLCADSVFPREAEVDARAAFSVAPEDGATS